MYIYTLAGAGGFGLGMVVVPQVIQTLFSWPVGEPIAFRTMGSIYVAFGLLSILGLWAPLRFVPVLLLQLCYKVIWFIAVFLPLALTAHVPGYGRILALIFASYIVGDLIAIPFAHLIGARTER
jgi:hypothetical protein